jgi:hypothetical protein
VLLIVLLRSLAKASVLPGRKFCTVCREPMDSSAGTPTLQ